MANAVMACMRNEAMFVSEWVAYHLAIGFDQVFVCTNNCTDGTDAILDHLARLAPVYHIRNDGLGGLAPQRAGVLKVLAHPALAAAEWLLHIDADEFLNIHHGNGQVSDLLAHIDGFDAAAFTWRLFGDSHITAWEGGLVTERQTLCEARRNMIFRRCTKPCSAPRCLPRVLITCPKTRAARRFPCAMRGVAAS